MVSHTGLVVSTRPRKLLMMVLDSWPIERVAHSKPSWMPIADWINLLVWLILVTAHNEPPQQAWYRSIDRAFEAIRVSLRQTRIVNMDELAIATEAVYVIGQTYQQLCPLLYPILATIYPQIQEGYRIHFDRLDSTGLYLILTLE